MADIKTKDINGKLESIIYTTKDKKDFITETNGEYYVYDHFFMLWLQRRNLMQVNMRLTK